MLDRLFGIEVFAQAIRLGGLSAAARELSISPAMAAKHLDALETRLGTTLVRRTTRKLSLTDAGRQFLPQAQNLLLGMREAEEAAAANTADIRGLLRVSAPATFGVMHIAPLIQPFTRRHPGVSFEMGLNDRYVDLIDEGWDMAVRIGQLGTTSLTTRQLAPVSSVVCASPGYLAERGVPRTLTDLGSHNCLGYYLSANAGSRHVWRFGLDGELEVPVHGNLYTNNGEALVAAAIAGQGLVYGPRFIPAAALRRGDLVDVTLDVPLVRIGHLYIVTHPDRWPTRRLSAWTDYLTRCFADGEEL